MQWILASASPRRKELFKKLVKEFTVLPARGEERAEGDPTPDVLACRLATQKAEEVASLPEAAGKAVLGADTVVALGNEVFGKPKDEADAARMLRALSGRTHEVYTGVCILYPRADGYEKRAVTDCTRVAFYELSEQRIAEYIATGSPMDKAGAYGIQDGGLVRAVEGSYSNVVGLPLELCGKLMDGLQTEKE